MTKRKVDQKSINRLNEYIKSETRDVLEERQYASFDRSCSSFFNTKQEIAKSSPTRLVQDLAHAKLDKDTDDEYNANLSDTNHIKTGCGRNRFLNRKEKHVEREAALLEKEEKSAYKRSHHYSRPQPK